MRGKIMIFFAQADNRLKFL